eukprot:1157212-Pelagomonas_calceolata.AAC.7
MGHAGKGDLFPPNSPRSYSDTIVHLDANAKGWTHKSQSRVWVPKSASLYKSTTASLWEPFVHKVTKKEAE